MEWIGTEWIGMDWNGLEWIGMKQNGMEWGAQRRETCQEELKLSRGRNYLIQVI